ncbi:hypothetical protein [Haloarcula sediminis]|uniref:hypothetical protein n=1 Tax=Haloarcula sediminis TaxID=3111777 RepID=UPI002D78A8D6|nr:hypothetical protein [Haloarcula sp. CK38]
MAGNHRNATCGKANHTSRRRFIRTVGVGATTAAVGTASTGTGLGATNTVDLGAEGLGNGDLIDPYFEEFFNGGTAVHVPAGEYDFGGGGLDGAYANAALVGSADGVTLTRSVDPEAEARQTTVETDGQVRIENVAIRGERGGNSRVGPASRPNRIEIDGAGDTEGASYALSVTGDLTLDEAHTVVGSGEALWLTGDISEGNVSGHVRNGADAFFYSGQLERVETDGDADINIFYN